jgi:hypothetical protein
MRDTPAESTTILDTRLRAASAPRRVVVRTVRPRRPARRGQRYNRIELKRVTAPTREQEHARRQEHAGTGRKPTVLIYLIM